jgi:hypothetical protein
MSVEYRNFTDTEVQALRNSQWHRDENGNDHYVGGDTFVIPFHKIAALDKKFAAFARRAKKLSLNSPSYEVIGEWNEKVKNTHPSAFTEFTFRKWNVVRVTGAEPVIDGYVFKATLDHTIFQDHVHVRTVPGATIPEHLYSEGNDSHCDHCGKIRRRNETFIVFNENEDRYMKVGRQCVKDFLGGKSPTAVVRMMEFWETLAREGSSGGWGREYVTYDLQSFIAWTAAVIRRDGWMSRGAAYQSGPEATATADTVLYLVTPPAGVNEAWIACRKNYNPTEIDYEVAGEAIEWAANVDPRGDYLYNINAIAVEKQVNYRTAGHAASIIQAHHRAVEKELNIKELQKSKADVHFGNVKERTEVSVRVVNKVGYESQFGHGVRVEMIELETNAPLTWFAMGDQVQYLVENHQYNVKLTVKKHTTYNNLKQTLVNRVVVVNEIGAE